MDELSDPVAVAEELSVIYEEYSEITLYASEADNADAEILILLTQEIM